MGGSPFLRRGTDEYLKAVPSAVGSRESNCRAEPGEPGMPRKTQPPSPPVLGEPPCGLAQITFLGSNVVPKTGVICQVSMVHGEP